MDRIWLEATMVGQKDTVVGLATSKKKWDVLINMAGVESEWPIFLTGLDEDGDDIDGEQLLLYVPSICLLSVNGYGAALSVKRDGLSLTCKYSFSG